MPSPRRPAILAPSFSLRRDPDSPLLSEVTVFILVALAFVGGMVAMFMNLPDDRPSADPSSFESRLGAQGDNRGTVPAAPRRLTAPGPRDDEKP